MPQVIYNEGRVQGYNAYEIYIRQLRSEFPDAEVPSEKEWLSSILANGLSMILKIKAGTEAGYHDYSLPAISKLCGTTGVLATVFDGTCKTDKSDTWAISVTDYGMLCSNTSAIHPDTPGDTDKTFPIKPGYEDYNSERAIKEYVKISDGIIYQPGQWKYPDGTVTELVDMDGNPVIEYENREPFMDFVPDLSSSPIVRLKIDSTIMHDTYILLWGFIDKTVLRPAINTESGYIYNSHPEDGDFLGPQVFPWCSKITFVVTNQMLSMSQRPPIVKQLGGETSSTTLRSEPVIDMDRVNPADYYAEKFQNSAINLCVKQCSTTGDSVSYLAVYQREDIDSHGLSARDFPPVMYATKVTSEGEHKLVPIDVAAPGSLKLFTELDKASAYHNVLPNVYAIYRDSNGYLYFVDSKSDDSVKMIDLSSSVKIENTGTKENPFYQAVIQSGSNIVKVPTSTDDKGNPLDKIQFAQDVEFQGQVIQHGLKLTDADYITFGNGLRFYVSNTEPENDGNIPIGSIGIGW